MEYNNAKKWLNQQQVAVKKIYNEFRVRGYVRFLSGNEEVSSDIRGKIYDYFSELVTQYDQDLIEHVRQTIINIDKELDNEPETYIRDDGASVVSDDVYRVVSKIFDLYVDWRSRDEKLTLH